MTAPRWKESCSCSTPAVAGATSRHSWGGGPGTPHGGGCASGKTPACGTGCTSSFSTSSAGSKYHILCDANGLPLYALLSAANTHDSTMFEPLLETNPAVRCRRGRSGRPRRRPDKLHADKGYDYRLPRLPAHHGIKVRIARRAIEDKSKLGRIR